VSSEAQDFLPSSWAIYWPTVIDWTLLFGTISFFLFLFLLFLRFVPFIPISELQELAHKLGHERDEDAARSVPTKTWGPARSVPTKTWGPARSVPTKTWGPHA
jgi:hypothetical protein